MINSNNFPGMDGFVWWTGIVEDRKDPEKLERVQVRMYMWHVDDKSLIPTDKLFWAIPIFPSNSSNNSYCVKEGDAVFGFWLDSRDIQQPYIFGRFPDRPEKIYPPNKGFSDPGTWLSDRPVEVASRTMRDGEGMTYSDAPPTRYPNPLNEQTTSRFARNENLEKTPLPFVKENIIKNVLGAFGVVWDEVDPDYATVYPYNDSKQSESGHYVDVDDTRKKERINLMHRTGTMQEMRHTGSIHRKDLRHAIQLVHGTDFKNIRGNLWHTTERFTRYRSKGKTFVEINADTRVGVGIANKFRMDVGLDTEIFTGENMKIRGSTVYIYGKEKIILDAPEIILNGDVYVKGKLTAPITYSFLVGDVLGNLEGTAEKAVISNSAFTEGPAVPTVTIKRPTYKVRNEAPEVEPPETIDNPEAPIDEVTTNNSTAETPEKTFQDKMDDLLSKITAPGAGGPGACWTYTMPDGTTGSLHTHHATGSGDVYTYFWCLGATSVTENDGCQANNAGAVTQKRPNNYSCPI